MSDCEKKPFFRLGDLVAILLVAVAAGLLLIAFFAADRGGVAQISVDGEVVAELPLDTDTTRVILSGEHTLTVVIEGGEVYVRDANCPDHVCEQTGRITKQGTAIACAPAKILVKIVGGGEGDVDRVAG